LTGGIVTLRSRPDEVELVSALPNIGYVAKVEKDGPEAVEVKFENADETYEGELHAEWRDGMVDVDIDERFGEED
jgi:hypothetical protein